jgi:hypothetical protein
VGCVRGCTPCRPVFRDEFQPVSPALSQRNLEIVDLPCSRATKLFTATNIATDCFSLMRFHSGPVTRLRLIAVDPIDQRTTRNPLARSSTSMPSGWTPTSFHSNEMVARQVSSISSATPYMPGMPASTTIASALTRSGQCGSRDRSMVTMPRMRCPGFQEGDGIMATCLRTEFWLVQPTRRMPFDHRVRSMPAESLAGAIHS